MTFWNVRPKNIKNGGLQSRFHASGSSTSSFHEVIDPKSDKLQRRFEPKEIDIIKGSTKQLNELIDHKCRQLGKTKTTKGGAIHLAEWMKGQLGNNNCQIEPDPPDKCQHEPEPEIWSQEQLKRRTTQLQVAACTAARNESRCEEIDMSSERSMSRNTEFSQQSSTSESLTTIKSNHAEKPVPVCRQCRDTCLKAEAFDDDDYDDTWGSLLPCARAKDPFTSPSLPAISVLPPTPDKHARCTAWEGPPRSPKVLERQCSSAPCSPVPTIVRPHSRISEIIEGDEDDDTPDGSQQSSEMDQPYRTLSSSLRRYGTLASLDQVGSDSRIEEDFSDEEEDGNSDEVEKAEEHLTPPSHSPSKDAKKVDQCSPIRSGKTYPEVMEPVRSWVAPPEVATPVRGWTARAGSFVAEKMALFERLSVGETNVTTVRKTTFLERYLKPSSECHLDSPPDQGTNTSSSGRGDDEGETSGATSGEEVWGTPTSGGGGEFEEELVGESSALSFMDSPHGSLGGDDDDDTEQLMEDLMISLPMLASRAPGVPPRRRLEPLPEEDDTESSSAPCSPKPLHEIATGQGRASSKFQVQHHDNCENFGTNSSIRPLASRKQAPPRPRIGTIDRALGISEEDDEEGEKSLPPSSILQRLGLRRARDDSRKSSRLVQIIQGQVQKIPKPSIPKPNISRQLSKLPCPRELLANIPINRYNMHRIVANVTRRARSRREVADLPHIEVVQWGNDRFGSDWSARFKNIIINNIPKRSEDCSKYPMRRSGGIRRRSTSPTYSYGKTRGFRLGFLSGRKEQEAGNKNSAAYGGRPLFKYLFNRETVDDIPTTLPRAYATQRADGKQLERRFWKQLRRRRTTGTLLPSKSPPIAT